MKKLVFPLAAFAFSLTLFSFSDANEKKANFKEVKKLNSKVLSEAGSFRKYESHHYTGGKGTWSERVAVWSLAEDNSELNNVEKILN
jgi:hypothetical protein